MEWFSNVQEWFAARTLVEVLLFLAVIGLIGLRNKADTLVGQLDALQYQLQSLCDEADAREADRRDMEMRLDMANLGNSQR